jgi:precorrin-6A/cobalt-precorrin-6A reductase
MPISPNPDSSANPNITGPNILLLGDTIEAEALAEALRAQPDCRLLLQQDMSTADCARMADIDDFASLLQGSTIKLVVNAANPYEAAFGDRVSAAAAAAGRQILRLMRPAWQRDQLDSWIDVTSVAAAADICRWYGKRILITLGESDLAPFAGNDRCHFIVRLPIAPETPLKLAHHDLIVGRGPFAWIDERRLMMEQQIDLLVSRNIGGLDSYAKIDVARDLAIPVVMISRPTQPSSPTPSLQPSSETVAQAMAWIEAWQRGDHHPAVDNLRTGEHRAISADSE